MPRKFNLSSTKQTSLNKRTRAQRLNNAENANEPTLPDLQSTSSDLIRGYS